VSGTRCSCGNRDGWRVTVWHGNYSAFNGYRFQSSDLQRGGLPILRRTKAAYVEETPFKADA
jgi:hypothetical protein